MVVIATAIAISCSPVKAATYQVYDYHDIPQFYLEEVSDGYQVVGRDGEHLGRYERRKDHWVFIDKDGIDRGYLTRLTPEELPTVFYSK